MKSYLNFSLILILLSCSSTTILNTNDSKAKIFVNNKYLGIGSVIHTDMKIAWLGNKVKIKKKNCADQVFVFRKNEEIDLVPLVSGLFLFVPLLWVMKYKAVHNFEFKCEPVQ
jgi:hypothetical protein